MKNLKHPFVPILLVALALVALWIIPAGARSLTQEPQCVGTDCPPPAPEVPPLTPPTKDSDVWKLFGTFSVLVQTLVQPLKKFWQEKKDQATFDLLAALFFSELLSLTFKLNVFSAAGLEATTKWAAYICVILTGYLMSVGASQIHNLLSKNQPVSEPANK